MIESWRETNSYRKRSEVSSGSTSTLSQAGKKNNLHHTLSHWGDTSKQ